MIPIDFKIQALGVFDNVKCLKLRTLSVLFKGAVDNGINYNSIYLTRW